MWIPSDKDKILIDESERFTGIESDDSGCLTLTQKFRLFRIETK